MLAHGVLDAARPTALCNKLFTAVAAAEQESCAAHTHTYIHTHMHRLGVIGKSKNKSDKSSYKIISRDTVLVSLQGASSFLLFVLYTTVYVM